jgi:hypothetical protein
LLKEATRRTLAIMADDKDKPQPSWWKPTSWFSWFSVIRRNQPASDLPPPALPPLQQSVWVQDQVWEPPMRRNNVLYESQPPFVPPPLDPPPPPADAREGDIEARFQDALRRAADLTSVIDELRKASTGREIGPGHNQGPPLQELDQVDDLIALLKDEGPRVKTAIDAKALIAQTKKSQTAARTDLELVESSRIDGGRGWCAQSNRGFDYAA